MASRPSPPVTQPLQRNMTAQPQSTSAAAAANSTVSSSFDTPTACPVLDKCRIETREFLLNSKRMTLDMLLRANLSPTVYCERHKLHPGTIRAASTRRGMLTVPLCEVSQLCLNAHSEADYVALYRNLSTQVPRQAIPANVTSTHMQQRQHAAPSALNGIYRASTPDPTGRFQSPFNSGQHIMGMSQSTPNVHTASQLPIPIGPRFPFTSTTLQSTQQQRHSFMSTYPATGNYWSQPSVPFSTGQTPAYRQISPQITTAPTAQRKPDTTQQTHTFTQTADKPNAAFSQYQIDLTHGTDHDDTPPNSDDVQTQSGYESEQFTRSNVSEVKLRNVEQPQHSFSQLQQFYGPPLDNLDTVDDVKHNDMMKYIAQLVTDVKAVKVPPSPYNTKAGQPRLSLTTSPFSIQCVQDRHDEFTSAQARGHDLPYKQFTNTIALKVRTAPYTAVDDEWPVEAPPSPPGFSKWLPDMSKDHAVSMAYNDVRTLETTSRMGQKIAGDADSALEALTSMLPPIPMAQELHNFVKGAVQDTIKLYSYMSTSLYQIRRDVSLTSSNFNDRERLQLRNSSYLGGDNLFDTDLLTCLSAAAAQRTEEAELVKWKR